MNNFGGNEMKRKYLAFVLSGVLITTLAVVGTLAYLNDTTEEVTNTFTFSDEEDGIHLELIETVFGESYDEDGLNEDEKNLDVVVNMVPGDVVAKNPTVQATGAECYLFVEVTVENNVAKSGVPFYTYSIDTGVEGYTWEVVTGTTDGTSGCTTDGTTSYVLSDANGPVVVDDSVAYSILADDKEGDVVGDYDGIGTDTTPVKGSVTINTALTADDLMAVEEGDCNIPSLSFVAYAVQSANIEANQVEALFLSEF